MALAAEANYGAHLEGLVVTPAGYDQPTKLLRSVVAGHPVPIEASASAAGEILALAESLGREDLLLVLLSGGASALLSQPLDGVTLAEKQSLTRALLASGAPISAINMVRKHLSRIKGGRLAAAAYPARTFTLAISDVPGDHRSVIASGPTVGDPASLADARVVLAKYRINALPSVVAALENSSNESIKPGDPRLARSRFRLIAGPKDALKGAERSAKRLGYRVRNLGDRLEGEARGVAQEHAALCRHLSTRRIALISGGELAVTGAAGETRGGRCREYALALSIALGAQPRVAALAADSDGIDGTTDAAGAFVLPGDYEKSIAAGRDPMAFLAAHRSGDYFAALERQLVTGPTFTNVGDLRVILVNPRSAGAT